MLTNSQPPNSRRQPPATSKQTTLPRRARYCGDCRLSRCCGGRALERRDGGAGVPETSVDVGNAEPELRGLRILRQLGPVDPDRVRPAGFTLGGKPRLRNAGLRRRLPAGNRAEAHDDNQPLHSATSCSS